MVSAWGFLLLLPYTVLRASELTKALRGSLRLVRAAVYFVKDAISFALLAAGSLWSQELLL